MSAKFVSTFMTVISVLASTASITQANTPPILDSIPLQEGILLPPSQIKYGIMKNLPSNPGIELPEEQKNKLQEIHANACSQIEKILITEQQDYLKEAIQSSQHPIAAVPGLNLSFEQQAKRQKASDCEQIYSILIQVQKIPKK